MDKSDIGSTEREDDLLRAAFRARAQADAMYLNGSEPSFFGQADDEWYRRFDNPEFDAEMLAFIAEQERLADRGPAGEIAVEKKALVRQKWRKTAALLVLICGLGVSLAIVPQSSKSGIFDMVTSWTSGAMFLQFNLSKPDFLIDTSAVPDDYFPVYMPTKLPKELDTAETVLGEGFIAFRFSNEQGGEEYVTLLQSPHRDSFRAVLSGEEAEFSTLRINGYDGASVERAEINGIFWSDGEVFFLLTSSPDVSMNMLRSIAKSVERTLEAGALG